MGYTIAILRDYVNDKGLQSIVIEYRYNGYDRPKFNTYKHTRLVNWDSRRGRVKKDDEGINKKIDEVENEVKKVINELHLRGIEPTGKAVKEAYEKRKDFKSREQELEGLRQVRNNKSLLSWFDEYLEYLKSPISGVKKTSMTNRRQCYNLLKKYGINVTLPTLNRSFLQGFLQFLIDKEYDSTTIEKHFRSIKMLISWITDNEENEDIPIPAALHKVKIKPAYNKPTGLTVQEFLTLSGAKFPGQPHLEKTRDTFVLGVAMGGLRVSDLLQIEFGDLTRDKDGNFYVSYVEKKTGTPHQNVPINGFGAEILEKYESHLPTGITDKQLNLNLKEIAQILEFNRKLKIHKFDLKGHVVEGKTKIVKLHDIISTKMMRKTRVSIDAHLGIAVQVSMEATGHKTFKSYARYLDINTDTLKEANQKWNTLKNDTKADNRENIKRLANYN